MKVAKEQIVIRLIDGYFKSLGFSSQGVQTSEGNALLLSMGLMDIGIVITICDVMDKKFVKIEEIVLTEKLRRNGIGTSIMSIICMACEEFDVNLGLWTEDLHLSKWYNKFGLVPVEVNDITGHHWFEKISPIDNEYLKGKLGRKNFKVLEKMRKDTREQSEYINKRLK